VTLLEFLKKVSAFFLDFDGIITNVKYNNLHANINFIANILGLREYVDFFLKTQRPEECSLREFYSMVYDFCSENDLTPNYSYQAMLDYWRKRYDEKLDNMPYIPGALESVSRLREISDRYGIQMALLTNRTEISFALHKERIEPLFDRIYLQRNNGLPKKPNPTMAFLACKELCVKPQEVVMIGDGDVDYGLYRNARLGMYLEATEYGWPSVPYDSYKAARFPTIIEITDFLDNQLQMPLQALKT
jgi:HAD superfamily hydrolase (TIGR01549 family)